MTRSLPKPSRRPAPLLLSFGLLLAWFSLGGAACSSECNGRVVDGVCQAPCRDELCPMGHLCLFNVCRAPCSGDADCASDQDCQRVITDSNQEARLCTGGKPPASDMERPDISGTSCTDNADCDPEFGILCVEGSCTLTCEVHDHCPEGSCTGNATDAGGERVRLCEPDDFPRGEGQFGSSCPGGEECDEASNFACVGAGPGDIDAYCTRLDCIADSDCPTGFFCATERSSRPPCASSCDFAGQSTRADCIADSDIGPGRRYECGNVSLLFNVCLKREFCNECETDADCLARPNQVCAKDRSGAKICTVLCDPDVNSCPWGNASVCGLWDEELGRETCAHRFGSCQGEGLSCEPCIDAGDCPNGFCAASQFSGERYCVDLSVDCSCPEGTADICLDGGCPLTPEPAGRPMSCFGGQRFSGTVLENKCFGGGQLEQGEPTGCWPAF